MQMKKIFYHHVLIIFIVLFPLLAEAELYNAIVRQGNGDVEAVVKEQGDWSDKFLARHYRVIIESFGEASTVDHPTSQQFNDSPYYMLVRALTRVGVQMGDPDFKLASILIAISGFDGDGKKNHPDHPGKTRNQVLKEKVEKKYELSSDNVLLVDDGDLVWRVPFVQRAIEKNQRTGVVVYATTFSFGMEVEMGKKIGDGIWFGLKGGIYEIGKAIWGDKDIPSMRPLMTVLSSFYAIAQFDEIQESKNEPRLFKLGPHYNVVGRVLQAIEQDRRDMFPHQLNSKFDNNWHFSKKIAHEKCDSALNDLLKLLTKIHNESEIAKTSPVYVYASNYLSKMIYKQGLGEKLAPYITGDPTYSNVHIIEDGDATPALYKAGRELFEELRGAEASY